ncbi:FAD-binding oxidoreductase [Streptomyces sp. NEAU-YJ-81]|uniref:FAD-binding oxidoreductase n=1 Tax=Streptomyces sp. NEAU-YJ-81 TaxID=2820288 RepID=UPI001ABC34CD|nr:FAD-binding oxidoreductase [Streptomyces sp. NEAU-YJ-81]MBO3677204.1 FAD-binding oxidoreductase [Streptomyces sp. NEAU-YJ-81]
MTTSTDKRIDRLADALRRTIDNGQVVTSGSAYDAGVNVWNGAVAHRPDVVVRCATPADARAAVLAAQEHGVPLSVRGGGHDWAGRALTDGGLTIDLSGMREVRVDPDTAVAEVAGGATGADLARAARPFGLTAATGTVGTVGMAGLSLGGGYGPLSGRFGLALDNVLSADVVLADGSLVTADAEREPELLWALRGGGGNFGLVTAMRVQLHRTPTLLSGTILFPWAQASAVLARLAEFVPEGRDELTVQCGVLAGPDGAPAVFVMPTWSGDDARAGEETLARLTALGEPLVAQLGPTTGHDMLASTDAMFPYGKHVEIRTRTVPALTSAARAALLDAGDTLTSPLSAVSLHSLHGIASRIPATDTAFGNRTPHLMVETIARWEPGDPREPEHRAWARDVSAVLESEAMPGGYPNLLGPDETQQIAHAYGPNTERLLAAKHRFDPDGVFRAIPLPVPSV